MNECHECGSEIAEIDAFCPFCGISLNPIVGESEEVESTSTEGDFENKEAIESKKAFAKSDVENKVDSAFDLENSAADATKADNSEELDEFDEMAATIVANNSREEIDAPESDQEIDSENDDRQQVSKNEVRLDEMDSTEDIESKEDADIFESKEEYEIPRKESVGKRDSKEVVIDEDGWQDSSEVKDTKSKVNGNVVHFKPENADKSADKVDQREAGSVVRDEETKIKEASEEVLEEQNESFVSTSAYSSEDIADLEVKELIDSAGEAPEEPPVENASESEEFSKDTQEQPPTEGKAAKDNESIDGVSEDSIESSLEGELKLEADEESATELSEKDSLDKDLETDAGEAPIVDTHTNQRAVDTGEISLEENLAQIQREEEPKRLLRNPDGVDDKENPEMSDLGGVAGVVGSIGVAGIVAAGAGSGGQEKDIEEKSNEESESSEEKEDKAEAKDATETTGSTENDPETEVTETDSEQDPERAPVTGFEGSDGDKKQLKPLSEGTVLNERYEIVRKIGGGGMGAVYLANDRNLGGILRAVKEMVQSYIEEEQQEKAIADFKRETMLLTTLEHSSIPTIYDYFYEENEGRFYLVMKYISGGDLAGRIRSAPSGKLDEKTVVEWGIQLADVLDYLHKRNPPIVYRDLKPANVMVDANSNRVMLIDFGIARWVNKEEKGVTAVGTMGYAPPELFSGNVEPRSDIYSLGSTMFHLLTGADPQSNPLLIFDFEKNPSPRQINSALSDQIEQILIRAVEYNADSRFETADEFRHALVEHLETMNKGDLTFGTANPPAVEGLSHQSVFCGFCGQNILATDMFCAFCGAKQPLAQEGVHSGSKKKELTANLIVENAGDVDASPFSLAKDENLIGRRDPISNIFPEVDLSKFDPQTKVSRRHARIWREGGKFLVEDLGSSNGTLVIASLGTKRIGAREPYLLSNGDKIQVGDTILEFHLS